MHLARQVDEMTYVDRGRVELKGLDEPVHVMQVRFELDMPAAVGATGPRPVTVWAQVGDPSNAKVARYVASVLDAIGYHGRVHITPDLSSYNAGVVDSRNHAQAGIEGWLADYPSPINFLDVLLSCRSFVPRQHGKLQQPRVLRPRVRPGRASGRGSAGHRSGQVDRALARGRPNRGRPGAVGATDQPSRPGRNLEPSRQLSVQPPVGCPARPTLGQVASSQPRAYLS